MVTICVTMLAVMLTGWGPFARPPLYHDFLDIVKQPNIANASDCSNKAGRYARCLIDVARLPAEVLVTATPKGLHAIVSVQYQGRTWYCDLTTGRAGCGPEFQGDVLWTVDDQSVYASPEFR